MRLTWRASPIFLLAGIALQLVRGILPLAVLYLGKLIIDIVVLGTQATSAAGLSVTLEVLIAAEFSLVAGADLLTRISALVESLLAERYEKLSKLSLMKHAALLDLGDIEGSSQQDRLERARRQVTDRTTLLTHIFNQSQEGVAAISLATGLLIYFPWLVALITVALVPSLLVELRFNAKSYRLNKVLTRDRRRAEYMAQLSSNIEAAKEVRLLGLSDYVAFRFQVISDRNLLTSDTASD